MTKHTYQTYGTCSSLIEFEIDENNKIHNVKFTGGCPGNLSAMSKLVEGEDINAVIKKLEGITCRSKNTSCGDQLAQALRAFIK